MIFLNRTALRRALLIIQLILFIPIGWFIFHVLMPRGFTSTRAEVIPTNLSSGPMEVLYYGTKHPKGIIIVATGDGGWSNQWEEPVARHAAAAGYAVGGWDCRKFADTRKFNHAMLVEAFNAAVDAVRSKADLENDCPVWYTGWSTGAEWALAAAAGPNRQKYLVGILPVAPGDRTRYGITKSDLLGIDPSGSDTAALADFSPELHGLSVALFAGSLDPLDDTEWIKSLHSATPHRLIVIPDAVHDMNGAGARFLTEFDMALQWTLDNASAATRDPVQME